MELKPTKAQILWLAEKYNTVPLSTTLPATVTPTQVLQKLKTVSRHCYMLESCEDKENSGRYTFLVAKPSPPLLPLPVKTTIFFPKQSSKKSAAVSATALPAFSISTIVGKPICSADC